METEITIREFADDDAPRVRELFIVVNRLLSPPDLSDAFEVYIAEDECRRRKIFRLELSTSELQEAALAFYRNSGYRLMHEDLAQIGSNKTVGAGLRRFYFKKCM